MIPDAVPASMSEVTQSDVEALGEGGAPIFSAPNTADSSRARFKFSPKKQTVFTRDIYMP